MAPTILSMVVWEDMGATFLEVCMKRESNYEDINYGERNLNTLSYATDSGAKQLRDYSVSTDKIDVVFRNLEERLIQEINRAEYVVGCVAWFTSFNILDALAGKNCQLIVQKEDFLRPDIDSGNNWKQLLMRKYSALDNAYDRWMLPGEVGYADMSGCQHIDSVRCVGNRNVDKNPAFPRMHNKFVLFCEEIDGEHHSRIAPYAVWTGSFNFTKNAGYSLENAVIIRDQDIVNAYAKEYGQIAMLSEPLDWGYDWCAPEYRVGT